MKPLFEILQHKILIINIGGNTKVYKDSFWMIFLQHSWSFAINVYILNVLSDDSVSMALFN